MNARGRKVLGLLALVAALAVAREPGFAEHQAIMDSLREMPRWEQVRWLAKRGLPDPYLRAAEVTDSGPLRCVGRWSYGPSTFVEVRATATDTVVFLSRGSGVSIIRFRSHDSLSLQLLADINCTSLTGRLVVQDTLLLVGSGGLEFYNIKDLTQPKYLGRFSYSAYDCFVVDTLLYTVSGDSLTIYSLADILRPRRLGACHAAGYVMFVSGSHAYLGHQSGLFVVDVSNPAAPHQVSSIGYDVVSITVRDSLLFFGTSDQGLKVYNVKNPASPVPLGSLPGIQPAFLYLPPTCDTVLYTPVFHAISIANPASPHIIGHVDCPGWDYCVAAVPALSYALVADYFDGVVAVDIRNPTSPAIDTSVFSAGSSEDICIDQGRAYVAQYFNGVSVLDVADPTLPVVLGVLDTAGSDPGTHTVAARDSVACVGWTGRPFFRVADVNVTGRPTAVGSYDVFSYPMDMVLVDSLCYVAEMRRLQILNVARPRQPVLVGSCVSLDGSVFGLVLQDTFAYEISLGFAIINVARPSSPYVVSETHNRLNTAGLAVRDTFAYIATVYDTFWVYSVADPRRPYALSVTQMPSGAEDVALGDTFACAACWRTLELFSVSDPAYPKWLGSIGLPWRSRRIVYDWPYFYAAMYEGGIGVFEVAQADVAEPRWTPAKGARTIVRPSIARGRVMVRAEGRRSSAWSLWDAAGRVVMRGRVEPGQASWPVDLASLPTGAYWLETRSDKGISRTKLIRP